MDPDIVNLDNWTELAERKQGVKTLAKIPEGNNDAQIAYFKYPLNPNGGPIAANEYIAAKIGERINLPVPRVQFKEFSGQKGAIIYKVPGDTNVWRLYPYKSDIPRTLNGYELLTKAIIFDVFVFNTDRNPDNLMYSRIGKKNFDFYLIDHAHTLYGPNAQPANHSDYSFSTLIQIPELRELFSQGFAAFQSHVREVQEIEDTFFIDLVNSVPVDYLNDGQKSSIKDLLFHRKKEMYNKIEEFCGAVHW